ncbi:uncharacterized protein LOC132204506 isoform X2 [Neocloeon triangulifer]|uniref:uncharacterized protein LOC132204506 isoform X2 n=1 Tax=Neocloeon triangulifer TaxID=2078957 RepID=UPI00286F1374|nr:uncharacterized protein LOC132204506 isoform X2 [Neocloeon triangulifer]
METQSSSSSGVLISTPPSRTKVIPGAKIQCGLRSTSGLTTTLVIYVIFAVIGTIIMNYYLSTLKICEGDELSQSMTFMVPENQPLAENEILKENATEDSKQKQNELAKNTSPKPDEVVFTKFHTHNQCPEIKYHYQEGEVDCVLALSAANLKTLSNGKTYSFHETTVGWDTANDFCTKQGLHLATIENQNDLEAVGAQASDFTEIIGWWLSAKNVRNKSENCGQDFRWHDGTKLDLKSPLWWKSGKQYNNFVYTIYSKLRSKKSNFKQYFICQLPSKCSL